MKTAFKMIFQKWLKKGCILLFLIIMLIPAFQERTRLFKEPVLKGAYTKPGKPNFTIAGFDSMEFQNKLEEYRNDNFGFRGFVIKIRNTFDYLLFRDLSLEDNIGGKKKFIFSRGSVNLTTGINYHGRERNDSLVANIFFMQNELKKKGVRLLTVIAPSKESVYPELLPKPYINQFRDNTDYKDISEALRKNKIPFIDFCSYFKEIKESSSYPLFNSSGFHWSAYGVSLAQDSLLKYIQELIGAPLPSYKQTGIEVSDTARKSDNDFEGPLNLYISLSEPHYYYPKLEMVRSALNLKRPKVIVIGDSFFWQIKDLGTLKCIFSDDSKFWYYFATTSFPIIEGAGVPLKELDIMKELESADVVLLIASVSTIDRFPFGVTDYYIEHKKNPGAFGSLVEYIKYHPELIKVKEKQEDLVDTLILREAKRVFENKKEAHIIAANGKYASDDASLKNLVKANRENASRWETFYILELPGNRCAIYSFEEKFLSPELNDKAEIAATSPKIGKGERFEIINMGNGFIAFKAYNDKYLSLDKTTEQIKASSKTIGENEKFRIDLVK